MSFPDLLKEFTGAVEAGDGRRLGALFTENGIYHDTFYGTFIGPAEIADMLENHFWRDAEAFRWDMREPVSDGTHGYAGWVFSYTSKLREALGKRVVFEGMSRFTLAGERILHYGEVFDMGIALSQTSFAPERVARIVGKAAAGVRERHADSRHLKA